MRATIYRMTYALFIAWLTTQKAPEWKIQDNSFLVEEAYNQDPSVVQHITGVMRDSKHHWTGTFTQEWPMGGIKNQLSYTLPLDGASDALVRP